MNKDVLLLTDKRIAYLERNELFGGWKVDWAYPWQEIGESPKLVNRGVQIFLKAGQKKMKLGNLFGGPDQSKIILIQDYNARQVRPIICKRLHRIPDTKSNSLVRYRFYTIKYPSNSISLKRRRSRRKKLPLATMYFELHRFNQIVVSELPATRGPSAQSLSKVTCGWITKTAIAKDRCTIDSTNNGISLVIFCMLEYQNTMTYL